MASYGVSFTCIIVPFIDWCWFCELNMCIKAHLSIYYNLLIVFSFLPFFFYLQFKHNFDIFNIIFWFYYKCQVIGICQQHKLPTSYNQCIFLPPQNKLFRIAQYLKKKTWFIKLPCSNHFVVVVTLTCFIMIVSDFFTFS